MNEDMFGMTVYYAEPCLSSRSDTSHGVGRDARLKEGLLKAMHRSISLKIADKSFTIIAFALHGGFCLPAFGR
jgi:hypothetical protein